MDDNNQYPIISGQPKEPTFETDNTFTDSNQNQPTSFFRYEKGKPKHLKLLLIIAVLVLLISVGGATAARRYLGYQPEADQFTAFKNEGSNEPIVKETTIASVLDGTQVAPELANRHPIAIVVENHPDARPQSGLEQASLVYEVVAEGGITRFLALYGSSDSEKVGPVRSARTFFVDWTNEYKALFSHVGGSKNSLDQIIADKILDLSFDQFASKAYWRQPKVGIASEHTVYTDTKKLRALALQKNWEKNGDFATWLFKKDLIKKDRPTTSKITIDFSSPTYKVIYTYNKKTNNYSRSLGSIPHKDGVSGNQLKPKNIIIQKVNRKEVESLNKIVGQITDLGTGEAVIFQDGKVIKGSWSKSEKGFRTKFFDQNKKEINFNPGQTFIEVISDPSKYSYEEESLAEDE